VPEARCILHLHLPYATALATLADPKSSEESIYARVGVLLGLKSVVHSEVRQTRDSFTTTTVCRLQM
jgi:ribulose-5-phosphate 4-epimerase/fuculose-1-phosphate aldolase